MSDRLEGRKRVLMGGAACAAIGLVVLIAWLAGTKEPVYDERKLSEWVADLPFQSTPDPASRQVIQRREMAQKAILEIGTNGISFLIKWIKYEPNRFGNFVDRLPPILRRKLYETLPSGDAKRDLLATGAMEAFEVLGERAQSAAPELKRIIRKCPESSGRASIALCCVEGSDHNRFTNFIHAP